MADMMQFDLVAPERRLMSGKATAVQIPGAEGDMTAMANHAPMITTLRPGILTVTAPDGTEQFAVTGGFAEITAEATTVLAERAYIRSAENRSAIEAHLDEARKAAETAAAHEQDSAQKFVADLVKLVDDMK